HRHQVVSHHPPAVYPGSIERIDFSEESEEKGVVIVEVGTGPARWRFVPLQARPFITLKVDVREASEPLERIRSAIAKRRLEGAVARLIVTALPEQKPHLAEPQIEILLAEAGVYVVAGISIEAEQSTRGRYATVAHELQGGIEPRRALELYLASRNIPEERTQRLLGAADELIKHMATRDDQTAE